MRRIISLLIVFAALFFTFSHTVIAAQKNTTEYETITFEDGSYLVISVSSIDARANNLRTGSKTYNYYNSNDEINWKAVLTAEFTYTGTSSTCTSASCTVTIYDNAWYEVSRSTTRSENTATTVLTMGQKFLGITINKPSFTFTLTCDKNGNLS